MDQARNKWKHLSTLYAKALADQPRLKSGAGAKKNMHSWCHFQSMSFMKDTIVASSQGNLEFSDDDEMDDTSTAGCSNKSAVNPRDSSESVPKSFDNAENEAEWQFLLSSLPYIDKIPGGDDTKLQFKLEAITMVFNYVTHNKMVLETRKVESSVKTQKSIEEARTTERNSKVKIEKQTIAERNKVTIEKQTVEEPVGKHLICLVFIILF